MRLGTYYRINVLRGLCLPFHGSCCDFGCNDGAVLHALGHGNKIGIDMNPIKKYEDVEYIKSASLRIPFADNTFDTVLCLEVLQYVNEDKKLVDELMRVVKKQGRAIICVPHKKITIFPFFMDKWLFSKWGKYVRVGYDEEYLRRILPKKKRIRIYFKSQVFFRWGYFPLRLVWAVSESLGKLIARYIYMLDEQNKSSGGGYIYCIIKK